MKRSIKTKSKIIKTEEKVNQGFFYKYDLIESESQRVCSYRMPLYSIRVELRDTDGNESRATTKEIFADFGKAFSFFTRLVKNLVTPIDLPYIVEDEL